MAVNVDINTLIAKLIEDGTNIFFIWIVLILILVFIGLYFTGKSGFISSIKDYSEYYKNKFDRELAEKTAFLNDSTLSEYKDGIQHHINVLKLGRFLNFKNSNLDVLSYILTCKEKERAIRLYKRGNSFLTRENGRFRIKAGYSDSKIKWMERAAFFVYFTLNIGMMSPFLIVEIFKVNEILGYTIPKVTFIERTLLYFLPAFILSILIVRSLLAPKFAKKFLELEKIKPNEQLDLDF